MPWDPPSTLQGHKAMHPHVVATDQIRLPPTLVGTSALHCVVTPCFHSQQDKPPAMVTGADKLLSEGQEVPGYPQICYQERIFAESRGVRFWRTSRTNYCTKRRSSRWTKSTRRAHGTWYTTRAGTTSTTGLAPSSRALIIELARMQVGSRQGGHRAVSSCGEVPEKAPGACCCCCLIYVCGYV